ncbi:Rne/Rng family ribonuclease [Marinicella sp. S6413]|nr:Rne/Rng family ribonuclease [Marinicella gelatinilytica]MCX7546053.1 Rne/Rng family ribonuclease [Marinicella gelatinilytica]
MKRMLINATHADEIRVAIADGQKLYDLDIDSAGHYRKKGNIYKAKITRIEPSLEACFVNYGSERHGFLPYKEISPVYCKQSPKGQARLPINKALNEGDEIIVQVNKEERGNKGAALSTYISLAGRYLVYMPNNSRAGGISRQIRGEERSQLQQILDRLDIPSEDGIIVRTAGLGRSYEELQWDFNYLRQVWEAILKTSDQQRAPFFIYQESDLFIRALRDYLQPSIGEILIDDRASYEKAREFMQQVMPHNLKKLSYYNDTTPLFSRYQIERQIQSAFEREVKLPSGGSLVIDHTEALLSIDINSAKATKGADVETTALNTNLEAADEIARQLRIRDLGGLVVIDFIDMRLHKNQRQVENRLRDATAIDRARVQIGRISKFGLLEMSRQRLRSSIADSSQITCPTCAGFGAIRSMESLIISIIRITEEEMIKPKTGRVIIQVPVEVSNKLLNEKREELTELEQRHHVQLNVISNENLSSPNYHVQRLNVSESKIDINQIKLVEPEDCQKPMDLDPPTPQKEQAALQMVKPEKQAPKRSVALLVTSWFKSLFAGSENHKNKKSQRQNQQKTRGKYQKSTNQKQSNQKQSNQKQSNQKQSNQKQSNQKQSNQKQSNQKQSNQKQSNQKQSNQKQSNQKQSNQKQSNQKQSNQKQSNQKQSNQKQSNQKQSNQKQSNQKQSNQKQSNQKQSNQKPSNQKPSNQKQTDNKQSNQSLPDQQQANKKQTNQNQTNQKQPDNKQSNQKQANQNPNTSEKNQNSDKPTNRKPAQKKQNQSSKQDDKSLENKQDNGSQDKQTKISGTTANKMKRPLGSVADLVAKKDPIVPSGAQIKKEKAQKQAAQGQSKGARPEDTKLKDTKLKDTKPKDTKPKDTKPKDTKPKDTKPKDTKPKDTKPKDTKPKDTKPKDTKPKDTKPKDTKPKDTKPKDTKPKDTKPKDTKPKDTKPKDTKPKDTKPKDTKPKENKPQENKPQENKPQENKPQENKPQENTSKENQPKTESGSVKADNHKDNA